MFRQTPGFTLAAVAALTLGIGANTAIFSGRQQRAPQAAAVSRIPDRLVLFLNVGRTAADSGASVPKFNVWREQTPAFQDAAAYRFGVMNLTGGERPEQLPSAQVTADFFRLFGAQTAAGRTFTADEDRPNGGKVVVLSHGFWQRRFGGDPQIVGHTLSLSGDPYTVDRRAGAVVQQRAVRSARRRVDAVPDGSGQHRPGALLHCRGAPEAWRDARRWRTRRCRRRRSSSARSFQTARPAEPASACSRCRSAMVRNVRTSLLVLVGAVSFVLLIACANVANLLLVARHRQEARDRHSRRDGRRPRPHRAPAADRERAAVAGGRDARSRARHGRHPRAAGGEPRQHPAHRRGRLRRHRRLARASRSRWRCRW